MRAGMENKFENYKEVTDPKTVSKVRSMVNVKNGEWKKDVKRKEAPPDYQFYFQRVDGKVIETVYYEVWYSDGVAEIFFVWDNPFDKRFSKEDSVELIEVVR